MPEDCSREQTDYDEQRQKAYDSGDAVRDAKLSYMIGVAAYGAVFIGLAVSVVSAANSSKTGTAFGKSVGQAAAGATAGAAGTRAYVELQRNKYLEAQQKDDEIMAELGKRRAALVGCLTKHASTPTQQTGCGSRGGPGFTRADGKCAGWNDWSSDGRDVYA